MLSRRQSQKRLASERSSFLEGATGLGTEVDAVYRAMSEGLSYSEALKKTQSQVKQFQEDNEALSGALEWGGIAAGFLIPGGILAKSGQAISKTSKSVRGGRGCGNGPLYGAAAEDLETGERNTVTGMIAGGVLGGLAGTFLIKNKEQLDAIEAEVRTRRVTVLTFGVRRGSQWGRQKARSPAAPDPLKHLLTKEPEGG